MIAASDQKLIPVKRRCSAAHSNNIHLKHHPYKKYVYGKDTFCIHFMYVSIDSLYKFRIFNKQFIFEHFLKKLMYTEKINHAECIRNF
ncbi:hypothetical protein GLOIN_2v1703178 [Rhizophagus irregularis DAOM 181602=DAOM 197198]|nr:hypothetical protein GLOIN_2v1703178 [Rhizophagus irregularis DAOM 181602=DAOM 197198]